MLVGRSELDNQGRLEVQSHPWNITPRKLSLERVVPKEEKKKKEKAEKQEGDSP